MIFKPVETPIAVYTQISIFLISITCRNVYNNLKWEQHKHSDNKNQHLLSNWTRIMKIKFRKKALLSKELGKAV